MKTKQLIIRDKNSFTEAITQLQPAGFDLHFVFADKSYFEDETISKKIKSIFNGCMVAGCSTSGEIHGTNLNENTFSVTSVKFDQTPLKKVSYVIDSADDSFKAGAFLANALKKDDLRHVFILSDGLFVNGTELLEGLNSVFDKTVNISGGLAGDNVAFVKTYVADNENNFVSHCVSAIGFYGNHIISECGSYGGWDSFGIDRMVTKSKSNIVYEIDNQPALDLYKSYLGEKAAELPGSAFYFPIEMRENEFSEPLVRTILGINESEKSITFAGNVPENSYVRLMKTNVNRVIEGANKSAQIIKGNLTEEPELVILISCVGRKIVLKQLTQDEVEAVTENFNKKTNFAGFYSNGEISKMKFVESCKLHNQTMTITAFSEKP